MAIGTTHFFLRSKITLPAIRSDLVPRQRLLAQMQIGMQHGLTLVGAPAGFGKTTLVSTWAQQCGYPVSWVSLDINDNDPVVFWIYVVTALQEMHPEIGKTALALLQSPQPTSLERILTVLLNELSTHQEHFALVLDDYHMIDSPAIADALTFLLEHRPTQMHLFIASRVDPPLPLARLRMRRQLVELRADALRFTAEEASLFLREMMGLDVSTGEIETLETRTEGWIAGLQLAALSMQGRKDIHGFITAFAGSHRYIIDYLAEEVLHQQSEAMRTFLMQTSILERMNASLCDAVTGQTGSQAILEHLEQANLFVVPLDDERNWYRYHHLFADVLQYHLRQLQPELVAELRKRASTWFEQEGSLVEAVNYAIAAEDFKRAGQLAALVWMTMVQRGEYVTLLRWLEATPEDVLLSQPRLCLQYAWILLFTGQVGAHERPLRIAEQAWSAEGNAAGLGEVYDLYAHVARLRGDAAYALSYGQQALALLPQDNLYFRGSSAIAVGAAYLMLGNMEEAHEYLLEGRSQSQMANNLISVLLATILLTDIEVMQGRLQDAAPVYQEVLQQAGSRPLWQVVEAHIALGSLFLEWNQLDDAAQHLRQAIALGKETLREIYLAPGYIILAEVMQARGEYEQAQEFLARAIEMAQKLGHDRALRWAMAGQARMALAQEDWSAIEQWISTASITLADEPSYEREVEYLMLARVGITQQRSSEVLPLLEHMLGKDEEAGRVHNVIAILVLQAKAYAQAKRITEAIKTLERAVTLAEPAGYVRVFVNEGLSLQALLTKMLSTKENAPQAGYIKQLLTAFPESLSVQRTEKVATKPITTSVEVLLEPLSGREQEVLELLAAGMANQKIAERLVVTVGTVKTHIKSIYGKLGVHSRTQAIVRARELGLL